MSLEQRIGSNSSMGKGEKIENEMNDSLGNDTLNGNMESMGSEEYLTFDGTGYGLGTANIANSVGQQMQRIFTEAKKPIGVEVFDNEEHNSQYSFLAVYALNKSKTAVYYYILLLAETGPKPLTSTEFTERLMNDPKDSRLGNDKPFTLDVMIDKHTVDIVENTLSIEYPDLEMVEVGSTYIVKPIEHKISIIADHVYKHILASTFLENGGDLNLERAIKKGNENLIDSRDKLELKLQYNYIPEGVVRNGIGSMVKADFELVLSKASKSDGYNVASNNRDLTKVYGYIDYIVETEDVRTQNGIMQEEKFIPHIIITDMVLNKLTTNFSILAIVTSAIMANKEMLIGHILKNRKELAAILAITALNDAATSKDIEDIKNSSEEEFLELILDKLILEPVLSVDAEHNGATEFLSPLLEAALMDDAETILEASAVLANSNKILKCESPFAATTKLPRISYHNGSERDGRDFTLGEILNEKKDIALAYDYNALISNKGSFEEAASLVSVISPDADMLSSIVRITLDPTWLHTLYGLLGIENISYNMLQIPNSRNRNFGRRSESYRITNTYFSPNTGNNSRTRGHYRPFGR